jgi:hypothetical protein
MRTICLAAALLTSAAADASPYDDLTRAFAAGTMPDTAALELDGLWPGICVAQETPDLITGDGFATFAPVGLKGGVVFRLPTDDDPAYYTQMSAADAADTHERFATLVEGNLEHGGLSAVPPVAEDGSSVTHLTWGPSTPLPITDTVRVRRDASGSGLVIEIVRARFDKSETSLCRVGESSL